MKLPKVFANPIEGNINNVQRVYKGNEEVNESVDIKNINRKINDIFTAKDYIYKSRVRIKLRDKEIDETIVGKTNINLLTMEGKLIKITDIIDIQKI